MNLMTLTLYDTENQPAPGGALKGVAEWELDAEPDQLTLALIYFVESRADESPVLVDSHEWETPGRQGRQEFTFQLPQSPYSFKGKLMTLKWAVELTTAESNLFERCEFVLTPTGQEIQLSKV